MVAEGKVHILAVVAADTLHLPHKEGRVVGDNHREAAHHNHHQEEDRKQVVAVDSSHAPEVEADILVRLREDDVCRKD